MGPTFAIGIQLRNGAGPFSRTGANVENEGWIFKWDGRELVVEEVEVDLVHDMHAILLYVVVGHRAVADIAAFVFDNVI